MRKTVALTPVAKSAFGVLPASNANQFDYAQNGNTVYIAWGTAEVFIIDCSNPSAPIKLGEVQCSTGCRGVLYVNGYLYTLSRNGTFTQSVASSSVEQWDVSNPALPVRISHKTNSGLFIPLYSAFTTDGTRLYVSGQKTGAYSFALSNLATAPIENVTAHVTTTLTVTAVATNTTITVASAAGIADGALIYIVLDNGNAHGARVVGAPAGLVVTIDVAMPSTATGGNQVWCDEVGNDWETQGCTYLLGGYVAFCNYRFGMRILDAATMGGVTDNVIAAYSSGPTTLRAWQCKAIGTDLYVTTNSTTSNTNLRGVLIMDVADPATVSGWVANYSMPPADVDTWNGSGDSPLLGIDVYDDLVFIPNGQRGVAVWDVTNRQAPRYLGLHGTIDSPDNLFGIKILTLNGVIYAAFGDGFQSGGVGTRQFYLERLTIGVSNMATIGLKGFAGVTEVALSPTLAKSLAVHSTRQYTAISGDVVTHVGMRNQGSAAIRTIQVGVYVAAGGTNYPNTWLIDTLHEFSIPALAGFTDYDFEFPTPVALTAGVTYTMAVTQKSTGGSSVICDNAASGLSDASRDNTIVSGSGLKATWTNSVATADDVAIWADVLNVPPVAPPELTTPYTPLASNLGDVVNIPSNFSGATSYAAQDLPDGCSINPTTGVITGTIASPLSGVPTVIAYNEFTTGVLAAIPWTVDYPFVSSVKVDTGALTIDAVPIATPTNMLFLSRFGLLSTRVNGPSLGAVSTSGDDLIVNGNTISSPAVLYLSPNGVLTDVPNNGPVANFIIN